MKIILLNKISNSIYDLQVNIPIKICFENGLFRKYGIEVQYTEVRQGTGAMIRALEENKADVAFVVTDALLVGMSKGNSVNMIGTFVGIFTNE